QNWRTTHASLFDLGCGPGRRAVRGFFRLRGAARHPAEALSNEDVGAAADAVSAGAEADVGEQIHVAGAAEPGAGQADADVHGDAVDVNGDAAYVNGNGADDYAADVTAGAYARPLILSDSACSYSPGRKEPHLSPTH